MSCPSRVTLSKSVHFSVLLFLPQAETRNRSGWPGKFCSWEDDKSRFSRVGLQEPLTPESLSSESPAQPSPGPLPDLSAAHRSGLWQWGSPETQAKPVGGQDGTIWTDSHSHVAGQSPPLPCSKGNLPPAPRSSPKAQAEGSYIPDLKALRTMVLKAGSPDQQHKHHLRNC